MPSTAMFLKKNQSLIYLWFLLAATYFGSIFSSSSSKLYFLTSELTFIESVVHDHEMTFLAPGEILLLDYEFLNWKVSIGGGIFCKW